MENSNFNIVVVIFTVSNLMAVLVVPLHVIVRLLSVPPIFAKLGRKTVVEGKA
jgi:hypothetical protein